MHVLNFVEAKTALSDEHEKTAAVNVISRTAIKAALIKFNPPVVYWNPKGRKPRVYPWMNVIRPKGINN